MEAVLIGAGLVLALYGFLRARRADESGRGRRRRGRPDGSPAGADAAGVDPGADPREQAMAVLRQPLNFEPDGWGGLSGASPLKQFRLGTIFGLGTGLAVAGAAMALFTSITGPAGGSAAPPGDAAPPAAVADPSPSDSQPPEQPGAPTETGGAGGSDQPAGGSGAGTGGGTTGGTGGGTTGGTTGGTSGGTGGGTSGGTGGGTSGGTGTTAPLQVTFNVKSGENAYQIAAQLKDMNIIQSEDAFISRLVERRLDTRLQAGRFQLSTGMTLDQVIDVLAGVS